MLLIWPNQAEKEQLVYALQSHRVNTLVELRRIEKAFAILGSPDVTEPMTAACKFAVTQQGIQQGVQAHFWQGLITSILIAC